MAEKLLVDTVAGFKMFKVFVYEQEKKGEITSLVADNKPFMESKVKEGTAEWHHGTESLG